MPCKRRLSTLSDGIFNPLTAKNHTPANAVESRLGLQWEIHKLSVVVYHAKLALARPLCKVWNLAELNQQLTLSVATASVVRTS